ncbi:MAG: hypothetical protein K0R84_2323 [Clostridia bacterium]|jgi:hypothetical protein|nr:hypothetical protein [Clostridia bacterium]
MERNSLIFKLGYIISLICFAGSIIFTLTVQGDTGNALLFIGGCILFITSIAKILLTRRS